MLVLFALWLNKTELLFLNAASISFLVLKTLWNSIVHFSIFISHRSRVGCGGTGGPPAVPAAHSHHPEEPDGKSKHLRERAPLWTWRALRVCNVTNGFIYMQNWKEIYWISFTTMRMRPSLKATTTSSSTVLVFSHFILLWERLARCCWCIKTTVRCDYMKSWMTATFLRNCKSVHCIHVSFEIIKPLSPNWKTNLPLSKTAEAAAAAAECIVVVCDRRMYYKIILLPTTHSSQAPLNQDMQYDKYDWTSPSGSHRPCANDFLSNYNNYIEREEYCT